MMGDRLSQARRAYLDVTTAANAVYAGEVKTAHALWDRAAADARTLGKEGRVDDDVIKEYTAILTAAGEKLRAARAEAEAEVAAAVDEAKQAGTFHWLVEWRAPVLAGGEPVDERGWLDPCEL